MNKAKGTKHVIDLLFPIVLFFVFVLSAVGVLVIAADIYTNTIDEIQTKDESRTALSYIATKIRQNDTLDSISITTIEGTDCLSLKATKENLNCHTYIYLYDGAIREIFVMDKVSFKLSDGVPILEVGGFKMEHIDTHLYHFTVTDKSGNSLSQIVAKRSK